MLHIIQKATMAKWNKKLPNARYNPRLLFSPQPAYVDSRIGVSLWFLYRTEWACYSNLP